MPSLELGIRDRWASDTQLPTLLPASRLFTGAAVDNPPRPYAVLKRTGTTALTRTSARTAVDRARVELHVWSEDLALGMSIASRFAERFDQSSFDLTDGRVLDMRLADFHHERVGSELWQLTLRYDCTLASTI